MRAVAGRPALLVAFIVMLMLIRAVPVYVALSLDKRENPLSSHHRVTVALYCTTALPIIVAVTSLAVKVGTMQGDTASTLVAAGAITVFLMPLLGSITYQVADVHPVTAVREIAHTPSDWRTIVHEHAQVRALLHHQDRLKRMAETLDALEKMGTMGHGDAAHSNAGHGDEYRAELVKTCAPRNRPAVEGTRPGPAAHHATATQLPLSEELKRESEPFRHSKCPILEKRTTVTHFYPSSCPILENRTFRHAPIRRI